MPSSKSWAHAVTALSAEDRERAKQLIHFADACGRPCGEPVTHYVSYRYITGRAGRATTWHKRVCAIHAAKFAERHDVEMPPESNGETASAVRNG